MLIQIQKDLSAYETIHSVSGINAAVDLSQLKASYKSAKQQQLQAAQQEEQQRKSEQDLKAAQDRADENQRRLAEELARPQPQPQPEPQSPPPSQPQPSPQRGPNIGDIAARIFFPPFGF